MALGCFARLEAASASALAPGAQSQPRSTPLPASWVWVGEQMCVQGVGASHRLSLPIHSPKGTKPYFFPLSSQAFAGEKQSLAAQGLKTKHSEGENKPGSCSGSSEPTPGSSEAPATPWRLEP